MSRPFALLLVRHGESTWNAEGRYQGRRDSALSDLGVLQAQALAAALATKERPRAIASSPLSRARQTAQFAAQACGLSLAIDARLVEIDHGAWEGELASDVARRWPEMLRDWKARPESVTFPGGESLKDVLERWQSFRSDLARFESPLVVVTHDVIVRLAALEAAGKGVAGFFEDRSDNCAITEIHYEGQQTRLVRRNDTTHLGPLLADVAKQAL
ncbi:MAG TPA: histidine phosphatase family protein [Candidatus Tumulicola sp.]|nr:histidine phosphatase family protein [Candidatus Tumulicola sp.]